MAHVEELVDFLGDKYDGQLGAATSTHEDNMYLFLGEIFRTCHDATAEAMRRTFECQEQIGRETNWIERRDCKVNATGRAHHTRRCDRKCVKTGNWRILYRQKKGEQGHRTHECPEPPRRMPPQVANPHDANLCEVENRTYWESCEPATTNRTNMTGTTGRAHPINTTSRNGDHGRICKKECHAMSQVPERTVSSRPSTPIQCCRRLVELES
ncbi:1394_t:CDS:2 [Acaulospora morrowiae]|uniref:1394_t:CDS:1 n=1 Tax=Acaulospora morrowiae TaxID=94023 RepID=A0A9N9DF19_9GLOM|nr:1394_t:CDS:2 [Acaulospora morrowiae]